VSTTLPAPAIPVAKPLLGQAEADAVAETLASGWVAQGPRVAAFERAFAAQVGAAHGVAVTSCTTALHLALVALGIGPGDEVVVPSLSFIATTNCVRYVGATPMFADVDPVTANLTGASVEAVLSRRTKAVVLVHQCGVPADVADVEAVCGPLGVEIIEDAACAAGSTYRGAPVGSGARLAAWSFHPRKLITTGEGGMVTTDRPDEAARLRRLREHGMDLSAADRHSRGGAVRERYLEVGFNYRLTDIAAAVGLVQLGRLAGIVARRRALAARYHALLADVDGLVCVRDPAYGETNYQSFWIVPPAGAPLDRDGLLADLARRGIAGRRGVMAAHTEPAYAGHRRGSLPVTEWLTDSSLILPLHHDLTPADQDRVALAVRAGCGA
jgi:dTDP-4-amino-4,6-dideoxygalactose transaminase